MQKTTTVSNKWK